MISEVPGGKGLIVGLLHELVLYNEVITIIEYTYDVPSFYYLLGVDFMQTCL